MLREKPIINKALINDLDNSIYHGSKTELFQHVPYCKIPGSSVLKAAQTPKLLKLYLENRTDRKDVFEVGTALHTILGEVEKFEYLLFDDEAKVKELEGEFKNPRASAKYKEWKAQYTDENGVLLPNYLPKDIFDTMHKARKEMNANPLIKQLFTDKLAEQSIFVEYDFGLIFKIRPDVYKIATQQDIDLLNEEFKKVEWFEDNIQVGDIIHISIKSTADASIVGFQKQAYNLDYHISEALYHDVMTNVFNKPVHCFYLSVEKDGKSHFTGQYMLRPMTKEYIEYGRHSYLQRLNVYTECMATEDFSKGYEILNNNSIVAPIFIPSWAS